MADTRKIREQLLVLKAQMGDETAFVSLVEHYRGRLLYYVRRLVGDADRAEDVLQDVWLTVYRKLRRLRSNQAFSVWLYRIARARAIDVVREESHYVGLPEDLDPPDEPAAAADEEADLARSAALVHEALERLTPEHRDVLLLRFLEEMPYDEIAQVTGCPLGTVKSRIHHAKRALRRGMEALQDEQPE